MSPRHIQVAANGAVRCVSHEELTNIISNALHGLGLSLVDVHGKATFVHVYAPKIAVRVTAHLAPDSDPA